MVFYWYPVPVRVVIHRRRGKRARVVSLYRVPSKVYHQRSLRAQGDRVFCRLLARQETAHDRHDLRPGLPQREDHAPNTAHSRPDTVVRRTCQRHIWARSKRAIDTHMVHATQNV